ncbi:hypothetical protein ACHAW5_008626 [Stephanodiscus triporus]|uniref:Stc1 domain-containing protein n=1 Tax=Stephanodiscus triporus TaxID=2934178 RepID=A0ABD3QYW9_9STRA
MKDKDPPRGEDPPEEYESASFLSTKAKNNNSYHPHHPSKMMTPSRHQNQYYPYSSPASPSNLKTTTIRHRRDGASSRDDDSTVHLAQYSIRNGSGSVNDVGKVATTRVGASASTMAISRLGSSDIDSKLAALTAKSRALRGMTYASFPPFHHAASSVNNATSSSSFAHPPSLTQRPSYSFASWTMSNEVDVHSHLRSTGRTRIEQVEKPVPSYEMLNEGVNSRLELSTRQSRTTSSASGGGISSSSSPTSVVTPSRAPTVGTSFLANNKKVTFEAADRADGSRHVAGDDRSVVGNIADGPDIFTGDSRSVGSRKSFVDQWNGISASSAFSTAGVVTLPSGTVSAASASSASESPPLPAGGISGTTVAQAARWNTSASGTMIDGKKNPPHNRILAMNVLCAKILAGYTMTRNHCPKCTMALLTKKPSSAIGVNQSQREECAYCPIEKLRPTINEAVTKRIAALGLSPDAAAGDGGEGICPISDAVCIEIVREEGRGGTMTKGQSCAECGGPELFLGDGSTRCVVCDVLKVKFGDGYRRSTTERNDALGEVDSPSIVVTNPLPLPPSSHTLIPKVPSFTSSTYDLTQSPTIKSNECPADVDFAKLQIQVQGQRADLLKSRISPADESQAIGQTAPPDFDQAEGEAVVSQFMKSIAAIETSSNRDPAKEGIVDFRDKGISINLAKLQDQLNKVVKRLVKCESTPDIPPYSLANLQSQLKVELTRAKESQAALELALQSSHVAATNDKSIDEIITELDRSKQDQITLENIIEGTNFIEKATSDDPGLATTVTEELLAASRNHSYSISQQEVDATGNVKEYIAPPSFFQANIPSEIIVHHKPEVPECDPSVAGQSQHTANLKRSERNPPPSRSSIDCCAAALFRQHPHALTKQQQDYDNNDCETIETDDFSADYTLNTMDDSRLMQCHVDAGDDMDEKKYRSKRKTTKTKFLFCFDCGNDDDAYSMVETSERGIKMMAQEESEQPRYPNKINFIIQDEHHLQQRRQRDPSSVVDDSRQHDSHGNTARHTPPGSVDDSDFGSMCRIGREVIAKRTCFVNSAGREVVAKQTHFAPLNEDISRPPSILHVGGQKAAEQRVRSPSPLSDWGSAINGSDFGSINRGYAASPNKPQPKSILRLPPARYSDHNSVHSDLTDFSSINRKVKFGSYHIGGKTDPYAPPRRGRKMLHALTEESGSNEITCSYT